jgi:hypothetical protein
MEVLKEKYPRTLEWLRSLDPFIIIRGENKVIVKFSDGRPSLSLGYEKIDYFESHPDETEFNPNPL